MLWVESFSTWLASLCRSIPNKLKTSSRIRRQSCMPASRLFAGDCCVTYSLCYQRQAAETKSLHAVVPYLLRVSPYGTLTGRTKALPRYRYCLSMYLKNHCFVPDSGCTPSPKIIIYHQDISYSDLLWMRSCGCVSHQVHPLSCLTWSLRYTHCSSR